MLDDVTFSASDSFTIMALYKFSYLLTYLLTYIVCNDLTLGLVQLQTNALADGLYCRYISAQIIYLSADGTVIKVPYIQF